MAYSYETPIAASHLNGLKRELGELFTVMKETTLSVKLKVDTPFVLGLVLAHIFNRWHKEGVSFDELKLNMKENTLLLRICKYPDMNRMKVECVECNERNS